MKTTTETEPIVHTETPLPAPQGIGMAVAFDWGLSAQMLATPIIALILRRSVPFGPTSQESGANVLLQYIFLVPAAALFAVFGEAIRRGVKLARPIQVVANSLGALGGIFSAFSLYQSSRQGNYWGAVASVILLIFSPLIAWRLSRSATRRWFEQVSSAEARRRHGGAWPWLIGIWAAVGGILQAISTFQR